MPCNTTIFAILKKSVVAVFIITFVASCSKNCASKDKSGCILPNGYQRVLISSAVPYQPWQVRAKGTSLTWSGIVTNEIELQRFAEELGRLPVAAGSAVFEVTESVSCKDRTRVRSALLRSGLCKQGRCWELEGVVKAPIVH